MTEKLCMALCMALLFTASLAKAEMICIEQNNGKDPICIDLGNKGTPATPIVIKPGKGWGQTLPAVGIIELRRKNSSSTKRKIESVTFSKAFKRACRLPHNVNTSFQGAGPLAPGP